MQATTDSHNQLTKPNQAESPFLFLGIAHRAEFQNQALDVVGLSHIVQLPFYPQAIGGLFCIIGIRRALMEAELSFRLHAFDVEKPDEKANMDVNTTPAQAEGGPAEENRASAFRWLDIRSHQTPFLPSTGDFAIVKIPCPPLFLIKPAIVGFEYVWQGQVFPAGQVTFIFNPTPPLSDEERNAVLSRPENAGPFLFTLHCKKCNRALSIFASLDSTPAPQPKTDDEMVLPVGQLPDMWACGCSPAKTFPLQYIKQGFHEVWRHPDQPVSGLVRTLYDQRRLDRVQIAYYNLLDACNDEQAIQKFLEGNQLLWSFLSPIRIINQPSILTNHKADFAILSTHGVLYLVEIEKPKTRLAKKLKKGKFDFHADLNHAFGQVRDWEQVAQAHRSALLSDALNIDPDSVHDIRYIVVAGMSRDTPIDIRRKLKHNPPTQKTEFFCFDELASFLHAIQCTLK